MAFKFLRFVNGINIVPKTPNTANEMGDLEVDSANGQLRYHNGTTVATLLTSASTDITILTPPLKFQETGGGTDIISVTAPANITASFTFKLPPDMGTVDYVLRTDGISATSWVPATIDVTPTGAILEYAGSSAPAGWKMVDGAEYDPALEPNLFAILGFNYNTGGETPGFFRVPDKRGRIGAGKDDMGGTPAGRLTTAGSGVNGLVLGATGGAQNHSLTAAENGPHDHAAGTLVNASSALSGSGTSAVSGTVTASSSAVTGTAAAQIISGSTGNDNAEPHTHNIPSVDGGAGAPYSALVAGGTDAGDFFTTDQNTTNHSHPVGTLVNAPSSITGTAAAQVIGHALTVAITSIAAALTAVAQIITGNTASSGSGTAHQNTQPTIILNYIIKA